MRVPTLAALSLALAAGLTAETPKGGKAAAPAGHSLLMPEGLKWIDGPPSLPAGRKMTVLQGDPEKEGPFTLRAQFPAGYRIPAHWHSKDELITVLSGSFCVGMGDTLDTAACQRLPPGGFAHLPARMHHFAWTPVATVIQLHGMGPLDIIYINPKDDPRKKTSR